MQWNKSIRMDFLRLNGEIALIHGKLASVTRELLGKAEYVVIQVP